MKEALDFAVIGGDRRQIFAAKHLRERGYQAELFMHSAGKPYNVLKEIKAHAYLLPIPLTRDGKTIFAPESEKKIEISAFLAETPQDSLLFAGGTAGFSDKRLIDYGKSEMFALYNAVPTAEGALLLAMQNLDAVICGMRVCVLGFGKVGRQTAALFHAVGADVTVFARREEARAEARECGFHARPFEKLSETADHYRLWLNTIPSKIVDTHILSHMADNVLYIELASMPYGIDLAEAAVHGVRVIEAGGLPGRFFPETAGYAVCDAVLNLMKKG